MAVQKDQFNGIMIRFQEHISILMKKAEEEDWAGRFLPIFMAMDPEGLERYNLEDRMEIERALLHCRWLRILGQAAYLDGDTEWLDEMEGHLDGVEGFLKVRYPSTEAYSLGDSKMVWSNVLSQSKCQRGRSLRQAIYLQNLNHAIKEDRPIMPLLYDYAFFYATPKYSTRKNNLVEFWTFFRHLFAEKENQMAEAMSFTSRVPLSKEKGLWPLWLQSEMLGWKMVKQAMGWMMRLDEESLGCVVELVSKLRGTGLLMREDLMPLLSIMEQCHRFQTVCWEAILLQVEHLTYRDGSSKAVEEIWQEIGEKMVSSKVLSKAHALGLEARNSAGDLSLYALGKHVEGREDEVICEVLGDKAKPRSEQGRSKCLSDMVWLYRLKEEMDQCKGNYHKLNYYLMVFQRLESKVVRALYSPLDVDDEDGPYCLALKVERLGVRYALLKKLQKGFLFAEEDWKELLFCLNKTQKNAICAILDSKVSHRDLATNVCHRTKDWSHSWMLHFPTLLNGLPYIGESQEGTVEADSSGRRVRFAEQISSVFNAEESREGCTLTFAKKLPPKRGELSESQKHSLLESLDALIKTLTAMDGSLTFPMEYVEPLKSVVATGSSYMLRSELIEAKMALLEVTNVDYRVLAETAMEEMTSAATLPTKKSALSQCL